MNGRVRIAFAREPSYLKATSVDGKHVQVGICRDTSTGHAVGMGSRAISLRYVNGRSRPVGYLSGLRILPEYRRRGQLLARGYRFLKDMHADGATEFYLTTIADDNKAAIELLTSQRAGLPRYHPWGRYHTLAISRRARPMMKLQRAGDFRCRSATSEDRDAILQFLHRHGPSRQFFPAYEIDDLFTDAGLLRGLRPENIALAFRADELVGTMAAWDQRRFKQTIIDGYEGWLQIARPLYNVYAALSGRLRLPRSCTTLNAAVGAIPLVCGDDPIVFQLLLQFQLNHLTRQRTSVLLLGLHEDDPCLPIARDYAQDEFVTRLYIVYWSHEMFSVDKITNRVPYLELGGL